MVRLGMGTLATHHFTLDQVERAIKTVGGQGEPGAIHCSVLPTVG